jgi:uncharacterized protein GlcG (DUF336 family)
VLALTLAACGGGGGNPTGAAPAPTGAAAIANLSSNEVSRVIAQAVGEAQAHGVKATIAVSDRVGNILGVYQMTGAATTFTISDGRAVTGGLEGVNILPSTFAAVSEAVTGAYLSSNGNAFTTRTASQIIQENFNPGENKQPSGPLFGVQFSQLGCSDLIEPATVTLGPHLSPLGLAGSPGGMPLYKGSVLVGGVGVIADGLYTIDRNINSTAPNLNELIAVAASTGFSAPEAIRANKIVAGRTLRYVNSEAILSDPAATGPLSSLPGAIVAGPGFSGAALLDGVAFGTPASGIRPDTGNFVQFGAFSLVDSANHVRYPVIAGTDGLMTAAEVKQILLSALQVASHTRAQIRQPLNSLAQISIVVVDTNGAILGFARTFDAPLFGTDVSLQKARTAMFFSQTSAQSLLNGVPAANYLKPPPATSPITSYVTASETFLGNPNAFADGTAYSARAIGDLARPFFPDGVNGNAPGPLSLDFNNWSVFSDGLQLDLDYNAIVDVATGVPTTGCTALPQLKNGIQIFPGGEPIYRGSTLVGGIGVSGDGVQQDDMVSFLGLSNAGKLLNTGIGNAPPSIRADRITPPGTGVSLLYVQCPPAPFVDNDIQDACTGL